MRRNRASEFARRLVQETQLSTSDLIYPVFVIDGEKQRQPVSSMPGVDRLSIDLLLEEARGAFDLGIPMLQKMANRRITRTDWCPGLSRP
jgi:porphobilinogen synthase